jgi:hypothetical protein
MVWRVVVATAAASGMLVVGQAQAQIAPGGVYVALGDSYTAAPLVPNQVGPPVGCLRSDHNYPSLVAAAIHPRVFRDVSCSGATTGNLAGPQPGATNPPQFDALTADTTLVTLEVGYNDLGYGDDAVACAEIDLLTLGAGSHCEARYDAGETGDYVTQDIDAVAPKIAAALQGIHARAPYARVLVVGYPDLLPLSGQGCWPWVGFSPADAVWFVHAIQAADAMLKAQALANGAEYVDVFTTSIGHDACELPGTAWYNGLIPVNGIAAPLHPIAAAEADMAQDVLAALSQPIPNSPAPPVPHTFRILGVRAHRRAIVIKLVVPAPGSLRADATVLAKRAAGRRRGPTRRRIVCGTAVTNAAHPGHLTVTVRCTAAAARALRPPEHSTALIALTFTPAGGAPQTERARSLIDLG